MRFILDNNSIYSNSISYDTLKVQNIIRIIKLIKSKIFIFIFTINLTKPITIQLSH